MKSVHGFCSIEVPVVKLNSTVYISDSLIKISRALDLDKVLEENIVSFYFDKISNKNIVIVKK